MNNREIVFKLRTIHLASEFSLFLIVDALRDGNVVKSYISNRMTLKSMPDGLPLALSTPEALNNHLRSQRNFKFNEDLDELTIISLDKSHVYVPMKDKGNSPAGMKEERKPRIQEIVDDCVELKLNKIKLNQRNEKGDCHKKLELIVKKIGELEREIQKLKAGSLVPPPNQVIPSLK